MLLIIRPNLSVKIFFRDKFFSFGKPGILPNLEQSDQIFTNFERKFWKVHPLYLGKWKNIWANFSSLSKMFCLLRPCRLTLCPPLVELHSLQFYLK